MKSASLLFQSTPNQKGQENTTAKKQVPVYCCFNPLPTRKARRTPPLLLLPTQRPCFNPLPTRKARRTLHGASLCAKATMFQSTPNQKGQENMSNVVATVDPALLHSPPDQKCQQNIREGSIVPKSVLFQSTPNQKGQENSWYGEEVSTTFAVSIHSQPERPGELQPMH